MPRTTRTINGDLVLIKDTILLQYDRGGSHMSTFGIPQRGPVYLIDDVTRTDELVSVGLTAGRQVEDEDTPTEIPEEQMHRCFYWPTCSVHGDVFCRLKDTNLRTKPSSRQGTTSYMSHT